MVNISVPHDDGRPACIGKNVTTDFVVAKCNTH